MKKKVFIALSGGVDSSVAALLLLEAGYDVTAVYMKNWSGESLGIGDECPWEEDLQFVEKVSDQLGIEFMTYNFEKEYRNLVINNFYEEYSRGNTPNPDILCNKFIKFDAFLEKAISDGADLIATGHYAITETGRLYKGKDPDKDQSYFLAGLNKEQLTQTLFPIGSYQKKEIRKIAKRNNLASAERKDSQGICFVGKVDMDAFLKLKINEKPGKIIDIDTKELVGEHNGVWFFTQGQRRGIGVGGSKEPYFVVDKDTEKNILYVAKGRKNKALWSSSIKVHNLHTIDPKYEIFTANDLSATIRYRGKVSPISLINENGEYIIDFEDEQWAPAPGQSVVIYNENECLGLAQIV